MFLFFVIRGFILFIQSASNLPSLETQLDHPLLDFVCTLCHRIHQFEAFYIRWLINDAKFLFKNSKCWVLRRFRKCIVV